MLTCLHPLAPASRIAKRRLRQLARALMVCASAVCRTVCLVGACVAVSACGSAGDPPTALPSGGSGGSGGTSSAGASNAGASNAGSSNGTPVGPSGGTGGSGTGGGNDAGAGECNVQLIESPPTSANHLIACSEVAYSTNPPSGGNHYAVWAAFQTYDYPVPVGFLVHDLEHGAVIFWYNCPEGCAGEVAEVQAFIDSQPEDPLCSSFTATRRAVLVPNSALPTRWAASAWGFALTANCFDSAEFGAFYDAHYGQGPESLCNDGQAIAADECP
jgi:Protein of unknown function (DUF3105)